MLYSKNYYAREENIMNKMLFSGLLCVLCLIVMVSTAMSQEVTPAKSTSIVAADFAALKDAAPFQEQTTTVTIVIDNCDTGVPNETLDGSTLQDMINECAVNAEGNFGLFVKCVNQLTKDWKDLELITQQESVAIKICAATSMINK